MQCSYLLGWLFGTYLVVFLDTCNFSYPESECYTGWICPWQVQDMFEYFSRNVRWDGVKQPIMTSKKFDSGCIFLLSTRSCYREPNVEIPQNIYRMIYFEMDLRLRFLFSHSPKNLQPQLVMRFQRLEAKSRDAQLGSLVSHIFSRFLRRGFKVMGHSYWG